MHPNRTPLARALRWLLLAPALAGFSLAALAQPATVGSLAGHITDATSKGSLQGARVSVAGTSLEAFTDQQGNYHLSDVPAGTVSVAVTYVGYGGAALTTTVVGGQTANVDAQLSQEVVKMGAFKVTSSVVGTARAVNTQRAAPALTNIVASDAIGALPDKNFAEALQRVPGVDVAKDKGEARFVNIRGLDQIFDGVSINGIRLSTAEKGTRETEMDVISSSFMSTLEVNKVMTPEMDTDAMGGNINIKTRSGFDQAGEQIMVQVATNYAHQEDKHGGYNFALNYANQFDDGLAGFALDGASESRPFTTYSEPGTTWSQVKSPTDGQLHWILASQDFRHYDARRWRNGVSTSIDFKLGSNSKAYFRFLDSSYVEANQQWLTTYPFGGGTVTALTDTSATVTLKAGTIIKSEAQIKNNKRESSMVGGVDTVSGPWTNNFALGYTTGKYTRPTVTIQFANTTATALSYNFNSPYNNSVAQISGPSLDSPSSYAFNNKSSFTDTTANMHEETVKDDLRYDLPAAPNPTYVKVGIEYRVKNNNLDTSKWGITSVPYTLSQIAYPGNDIQDTMGGFPQFQIRQEAVQQFYTNQSLFPTTLTASTTYGGAFQAKEDIAGLYAMAGMTIQKLKIMAGIRAEDTYFWQKGWQFDSTTSVVTPVSNHKDYTEPLPAIVGEYEFTPQTIGRFSWTNTLSRPDYSATTPGRTVDDVNHLISQGNINLAPLKAMNWDASIEHYYSPLGLVSAALFYKSITNFNYQAQGGTDPATGYLLTSFYNGPKAWIYGLELNWVQQLSFLPGALSGLGLQANSVLGDSQAQYPTRPGESIPFTGFGHTFGNLALTYSYGGWNARLAEHFHGRRLEANSTIGANSTQDQYEEPYRTLDASLSYTFLGHWQIYVMGSNLNNAPLKEYYGGTGSLHRIQTYEAYGWSADGGIRWNY